MTKTYIFDNKYKVELTGKYEKLDMKIVTYPRQLYKIIDYMDYPCDYPNNIIGIFDHPIEQKKLKECK